MLILYDHIFYMTNNLQHDLKKKKIIVVMVFFILRIDKMKIENKDKRILLSNMNQIIRHI